MILQPASSVSAPRLEARPRGWSWSFAFAGLVGLWLLARPYTGVRHDGVLYLGQIYLQLDPAVFSRDLFFAYGSQDQYSLFSKFGATLNQALGLEGSQFLLLLLGHCLLLVAAALLLKPLESVQQRVFGLISLAVMPHFYGGMGIFSFAETFVTARTIAEPLGLLALACLIRGHRAIAMFAAIAAALMHPLMALPVFVSGWAFLVANDRRWAWLLVPMTALVCAFVAAGLGPFENLLRNYDADWLKVIRQTNSFVFPLSWAPTSWALTLSVLMFLCLSARLLPRPVALLAIAVGLTSAALLLLSVLGADALHNVLLTQLQLWRALWIAHLLAIALLPAVLMRLWCRGGAWMTASAGIAAAAIALTADWPSSPLVLAWAVGLCLLAKRNPTRIGSREWALLHRATIAMLLLLTMLLLASNLRQLALKGVELGPSVLIWALSTTPLLVFAAAWLGLNRVGTGPHPRLIGAVLSLLLLAVGVSQWDRRTDTQRIVEARPAQPHPFALITAPNSQVYWRDSLNHTWGMLGRASYFTDHQGSGVLFARPTAMEFERRKQLFAKISFQREICMLLAGLNQNANWGAECVPDIELVTDVCRADRGPDYLVFPFALARGSIASWTLAPPDATSTTFYLHDCTQLR